MLKVSNLSAGYGNLQVLRDISFEIAAGELVSILGTNGAGKTTLLRTISGLIKASKGTVNFLDEDIQSNRPEEIVKKGLIQVPEGRMLFNDMTVRENMELGAFTPNARKNTKKNLEYCFELFPILKEREKQLAGNFSGGQQQMLAIARSLMSEPKLLLLDEPSTGLSPLLTKQVFEIIREIKGKGVTVLLVEQNAHQALGMSDRGYVIENGGIIMEGPAKDLMNNEKLRASYLGLTN